jgi:hypothetical protein
VDKCQNDAQVLERYYHRASSRGWSLSQVWPVPLGQPHGRPQRWRHFGSRTWPLELPSSCRPSGVFFAAQLLSERLGHRKMVGPTGQAAKNLRENVWLGFRYLTPDVTASQTSDGFEHRGHVYTISWNLGQRGRGRMHVSRMRRDYNTR